MFIFVMVEQKKAFSRHDSQTIPCHVDIFQVVAWKLHDLQPPRYTLKQESIMCRNTKLGKDYEFLKVDFNLKAVVLS